VSSAAKAYSLFVQGKENAGRERATLSQVFAANRFEPSVFERSVGLMANQTAFFGAFVQFATPEQANWYRTQVSGDVSASAEEASASVEQMSASTRTPKTPRSPTTSPAKPPPTPPPAARLSTTPSVR
jgi:hypothetical protein